MSLGLKCPTLRQFQPGLGPIVQEPFETYVSQRMLDHLLQNIRRHRRNVSPQLSGLHDMDGVANACNKDLSLNVIVAINLQDLLHYTHSNMPCIIQSSDERTHVTSTSLRSKQGLIRREDQGHVSFYPLLVQPPNRNEPLRGHRNLHDHIRRQRSQVMSFVKHPLSILAHNFQVHRSRYDSKYLPHEFQESLALLRNESRIRSDAVKNSHICEGLDRCNVGRVKKYLHLTITWSEPIFWRLRLSPSTSAHISSLALDALPIRQMCRVSLSLRPGLDTNRSLSQRLLRPGHRLCCALRM